MIPGPKCNFFQCEIIQTDPGVPQGWLPSLLLFILCVYTPMADTVSALIANKDHAKNIFTNLQLPIEQILFSSISLLILISGKWPDDCGLGTY